MRESDGRPSPRKLILALAIAGVSVSAIVAVIVAIAGHQSLILSAEFTEFSVCQGPDPGTGQPTGRVRNVPASLGALYVCGYLETNSRVSLLFLLVRENSASRWLGPTEHYSSGYVYREIPKKWWGEPGRYRVEAWHNRIEVDSVEFTVDP